HNLGRNFTLHRIGSSFFCSPLLSFMCSSVVDEASARYKKAMLINAKSPNITRQWQHSFSSAIQCIPERTTVFPPRVALVKQVASSHRQPESCQLIRQLTNEHSRACRLFSSILSSCHACRYASCPFRSFGQTLTVRARTHNAPA